MSDDKFTNRHGHTISGLQEAVNDLPEPEHRADVSSETTVRRNRRAFRLSRLQLRSIIIVILVVILTPVLVGEYVRGTYEASVSTAKNSVKNLFAAELLLQKKSVTSKTLSDVNSQLSVTRDGLCPGGFLDNLAKLYPRAQHAYDDCSAYRSNVAALQDSLTTSAAEMTYLEQLQPLLTSVSQPLEDQFAVLSSQQENWQVFVDKLNQLSVPVSFTSAHTGLSTQASVIRDQWIALVQASNAFDKAAYSTARAKLTDAYVAFSAQTASFKDAVSISQSALTQDVKTLQ